MVDQEALRSIAVEIGDHTTLQELEDLLSYHRLVENCSTLQLDSSLDGCLDNLAIMPTQGTKRRCIKHEP